MSKLTKEERRIVSIAKVGASQDDELLIKIIERLCGEEIKAPDKDSGKDSGKGKYSDPS